jgi:hypothetical protein
MKCGNQAWEGASLNEEEGETSLLSSKIKKKKSQQEPKA